MKYLIILHGKQAKKGHKISDEVFIKPNPSIKFNTIDDPSDGIETLSKEIIIFTDLTQGDDNYENDLLLQIEVNLNNKLKKSIEKSMNYILSLENNWDGEESIEFSLETLVRAEQVITKIYNNLNRNLKSHTTIPSILPSGKGSIDIQWDTEFFEIALNVPEDSNTPIGIYAEDKNKNEIELHGEDWINIQVLTDWLMKILED